MLFHTGADVALITRSAATLPPFAAFRAAFRFFAALIIG